MKINKRTIIGLITISVIIACDKPTDNTEETITDIDGNVYTSVIIGEQEWMVENLRVIHYRDGTAIPNITDNENWVSTNSGAYCDYDNDESNVEVYSRLYNWFAVSDSHNLPPLGWHIPSDDEWKELEMYLGMSQTTADSTSFRGTSEGASLKDTTGWNMNEKANNLSGFTAIPCGYRNGNATLPDTTVGYFFGLRGYSFFWTSTGISDGPAWYRILSSPRETISRNPAYETSGYSIRCVRD